MANSTAIEQIGFSDAHTGDGGSATTARNKLLDEALTSGHLEHISFYSSGKNAPGTTEINPPTIVDEKSTEASNNLATSDGKSMGTGQTLGELASQKSVGEEILPGLSFNVGLDHQELNLRDGQTLSVDSSGKVKTDGQFTIVPLADGKTEYQAADGEQAIIDGNHFASVQDGNAAYTFADNQRPLVEQLEENAAPPSILDGAVHGENLKAALPPLSFDPQKDEVSDTDGTEGDGDD